MAFPKRHIRAAWIFAGSEFSEELGFVAQELLNDQLVAGIVELR